MEKQQQLTEHDRQIIERLLLDKEDAWVNEFIPIVKMLVEQHGKDDLLRRTGHEVWEVISELYIQLHKDNFRLLRNVKKSLIGMLYDRVTIAVRTVIDPKGRKGGGKEIEISTAMTQERDDKNGNENTSRCKSIEELAAEVEKSGGGWWMVPDNLEPMRKCDQTYRKTKIQEAFSMFWLKDPRAAYVLLLHERLGMTYAEIGRLLKEKGNTVQSWIRQARDWWREIVEKNR